MGISRPSLSTIVGGRLVPALGDAPTIQSAGAIAKTNLNKAIDLYLKLCSGEIILVDVDDRAEHRERTAVWQGTARLRDPPGAPAPPPLTHAQRDANALRGKGPLIENGVGCGHGRDGWMELWDTLHPRSIASALVRERIIPQHSGARRG